MKRHLRTVLWLLLANVSAGCAAMRRTWNFEAAGMGNALIEPRVASAKVTRDSVVLELLLLNKTTAPVALDVGRVTLFLPDGTPISGDIGWLEQGENAALSVMQHFGWSDRSDPRVAPGRTRQLELVFRNARRDLRRFPWMTVDLGGVSVNGSVSPLPALVLRAPPEAPIGEDI